MSADGTANGGPAGARRFEYEGRTWLVFLAGRGVSGNPRLSPAPVQLVRFAHADSPDTPLRETIAPPRPIDNLFDEELIELFERAGPLREPATAPARDTGRARREGAFRKRRG